MPPVHGAGDLTVEWCNAALARTSGGAGRVVDVRTEPVGTGQVADTVRLHLTYEPPERRPGDAGGQGPGSRGDEPHRRPPDRAPTRSRRASTATWRPVLPVRTPCCHHAAHDPETDAYVVLLEDVAPARQGDQMAGCPVDDVAAAIDELVLLHGPRWGDESLTEIGWLHRGQPEQVEGIDRPRRPTPSGRSRSTTPSASTPTRSALVDRLVPRLDGYLRERPPAVDHRPRRLPGRQPAVRRRPGRRRRLADRRARTGTVRPQLPARRQPHAGRPAPPRGRARRPLRRAGSASRASPSSGRRSGSSTAATPSVG